MNHRYWMWVNIMLIVMGLFCVVLDLWQLSHFSRYSQWTMALNCGAVPILIYNNVRLTKLTIWHWRQSRS